MIKQAEDKYPPQPFGLHKELIGIADVQECAVIEEKLNTEIVVFEAYFK